MRVGGWRVCRGGGEAGCTTRCHAGPLFHPACSPADGHAPTVRYEGGYVEGRKCGAGRLSLPNGDRYNGEPPQRAPAPPPPPLAAHPPCHSLPPPLHAAPRTAGFFDGDRFHGDGTYLHAGGDAYSGAWARGTKQGEGTFLVGADGSQLTGTWMRGALVAGKWVWADGTVWLGTFRDSRPLGRGLFVFPSGLQQEGEYVMAPAPEGGEPDAAAAEAAVPVWRGGRLEAATMPARDVIRAPMVVG